MKTIICKSKEYEPIFAQRTKRSFTIEHDLGEFYRLYEYTDDICVLDDNPLYPGLLNYVKTGLLTEEELIEALEYTEAEL